MRFLIIFGTCLLAAGSLQAKPVRRLPIRHLPMRRAVPIHIPRVTPLPHAALPRAAAPHAPAIAADPAARDLLKRMLQAENSLALSGNQVTLVVRNGLDISSEQQVQRSGARALRLDYVRPARLAGEQIIDNGRFYCHLVPAKDTLELSPSRIQTLRVRVPEVIQQIKSGRLIVQQVGQETVAGHACGIIEVMARSAAPVPFRKFWIDPTNGAQLRIEQYDTQGQLQSASYYTQVTYNPVFDKATFRLPSSGGKVVTNGFVAPTLTLDQVRAQAGFPVQVPAVLPEGFHYQGGSVSDKKDYRVVELRYFNGVTVLSVFETPDKPDSVSSRPEHPRRGVLFGRQAGLKIVIIANLGNAALNNTLTSLK
jgi:negative regulator of sigma E activity